MATTSKNNAYWGFSAALAVAALALAGFGFLMLNQAAQRQVRTHQTISRQRDKVRICQEAIRRSSRNSRITMEILLREDRKDVGSLQTERAHNTDSISELLKQLSDGSDSSVEKALILEVWDTRNPYIESYKEVLSLCLDKNRYDDARTMMARVTLPRLTAYHDAWNTLITYETSQIDKAEAALGNEFNAETRQVAILMGVGGAAATGLLCVAAVALSRATGARFNQDDRRRESNSLPDPAEI